MDQFSRTELIFGKEAMEKPASSRVARKCTQRRQVTGSNAFVPSVVGLIIVGEVIKALTAKAL